jgi:hypothetical protein
MNISIGRFGHEVSGSHYVTSKEADRMFSDATGWSPPTRSFYEVFSDSLKCVGEYFSRSKSR